LTSFKIFLVKFQVSTLDESHNLLVILFCKRLWKSRCYKFEISSCF